MSFHFNHLCHFKSTRALYHLPVVIASPLALIAQCACYFTPLLFNLHAPHSQFLRHQQIVYSYTTFISTPFALLCLTTFPTTAFCKCSCKIIISLDVFHSLPPNHTNQIAASITQIIVRFAIIIITSTFTSTCHSFPHFDSTSARIHSTLLIDFRPTFAYFNFNYY